MKKTISRFSILFLLLFFLCSCGSQKIAEKRIEKEIQNENIAQPSDLENSAREYILKSETLSELQKKSLISLQDKTVAELKSLKDENSKLKLVLIKTILRPNVDEREVAILKRKIKKNNKKTMNLDFKSFDEARKIIDPLKEVRDREFLYNSFMMRNRYYW